MWSNIKQFLWNKKCQCGFHSWVDESISISCQNPECCAIRYTAVDLFPRYYEVRTYKPSVWWWKKNKY